jgi:hypothetical protein
MEVTDRMLYDVEKNRTPIQNGALDAKLVGFPLNFYIRIGAYAQGY